MVSLGEGFGDSGWWGLVFLWKMREMGRGWGGSRDRQRNRQVNTHAFVKATL